MHHKILDNTSQQEVADLFMVVFTSSEGEQEGKLIGELASKLSSGIDDQEIICIGTYENDSIIGSIFFTHLRFKEVIRVYMLAPVAVSTRHQGRGVGQALINYGLDEMRRRSVDVVVTYGDPAFYTKTGFLPLQESSIKAPLKLSMPQGWLGQSLTQAPIPTLEERPECVRAFNDPVFW